MFPPDPQVSALRQEGLHSLNYYHAWGNCWQPRYLQRTALPLSAWLCQPPAALAVTRYFASRMYGRVMCLPLLQSGMYSYGSVLPRQLACICTPLFLSQAAHSPPIGTKPHLSPVLTAFLPPVLQQPANCVGANSPKPDTALPFRLALG